VDFLQREYGDRFHHVTGIRGHELNDVYASAKVVVGDCIFAGTPFYWSDRVAETIGRRGFLIHPYVQGLEYLQIPKYKPQDLNDLKELIDLWLPVDEERQNVLSQAVSVIQKKDTWTIRMQEILTGVLP
jgi:hypothetical protein